MLSLILHTDLSIPLGLSFYSLRTCLRRSHTVVCVIITLQLVHMRTERPGSHLSIRQTEQKESYSLAQLTQSGQPAGTWEKVLEGSRNKDGMTMSIVRYIECSLASFIFWASISLFCPLFFMLSFFHPCLLASLSLFLNPYSSQSPCLNSFSLLFIKTTTPGSPQVVSEHLHHHHHHCHSHYRRQTSLAGVATEAALHLYLLLCRNNQTWGGGKSGKYFTLHIQCHAADIPNTSLHSYIKCWWYCAACADTRGSIEIWKQVHFVWKMHGRGLVSIALWERFFP